MATVRELGSAGVPARVLSHAPGPAAASRYAEFVRVPNLYTDTRVWAERLAEVAVRESEPPVVFPTEDAACLALERYHSVVGDAVCASYPAPGLIERILDKRRLYTVAGQAGIDLPTVFDAKTPADVADLEAGKWVVKPPCRYRLSDDGIRSFRRDVGVTKAMGGDPKVAVEALLAARYPVMVLEQIPGGFDQLVTAAVTLGRDGEVLDAFVARKRCEYPEPFGDGLIVELAEDPGVIDPAVELLRALGYWGMCDVEFKIDPRDGRMCLLDANPRPWLWLGLGTRNGHHLALAAYNVASGCAVEPRLAKRARRFRWVSPRGTFGFLARCYRPAVHGWGLPATLLAGVAETVVDNLVTFRDPLYLSPASWSRLLPGG